MVFAVLHRGCTYGLLFQIISVSKPKLDLLSLSKLNTNIKLINNSRNIQLNHKFAEFELKRALNNT